jgi:hypothetical protein
MAAGASACYMNAVRIAALVCTTRKLRIPAFDVAITGGFSMPTGGVLSNLVNPTEVSIATK